MSAFIPWLLVLLLLSGCAPSRWDSDQGLDTTTDHTRSIQGRHKRPDDNVVRPPANKDIPKPPAPGTMRFLGTGVFVKPAPGQSTPTDPKAGDITLNFENTDLREVVKVILSDLLGINYILDPAVRGTVTMETGRPLTKDLLLPTLETLLRMNKAALVYKEGVYYVMPITTAIQGEITPQLGDSSQALPKGYSIRIVPLRYIGATEMAKILKPLAPDGGVIRVDPVRNLLVLAGPSLILGNLLETIETFDVNWIKGLSVGLFKIQHGDLSVIMKQVEGLTSGSEDNPLTGMFRIVPIEAANSLLVVTHQPEYLDQIGTWIERLDQIGAGDDSVEPTLYVYRVKHGDAANLAQMLSQLFSDGKTSTTGTTTPRVAPTLRASSIRSGSTRNNNSSGITPEATASGTTPAAAGSTSYQLESGVSIVADAVNNSLLLRATPIQYRQIESILAKLDILPLQVLVEVTIIEVSLNEQLKYGLDWFFKGNADGYTGKFELGGTNPFKTSFPGFNWSLIKDATDVRAVLSMFAGDGLVKVLSSPSVMVLDNHAASIKVGKRVPTLGSTLGSITTDTTDTTDTTNQNFTYGNNVNYEDAGVLLNVTPRVTPGGLVIMEVEQEVSDVADDKSAVSSPTFTTRNVKSTVAVKDDQVVVLGGLITDKKAGNQGGVPGLYKDSMFGWLFGTTSRTSDRTELLVIISPRIIRDADDIARVTDEFRNRLQGLKGDF